MSPSLLRSWPLAWSVAAGLHVALALLPVRFGGPEEPQELVEFELAQLPELPSEPEPEPEPLPEPEPPQPAKPPGPKNPDPTADPTRTSLESNRAVEPGPPKPVPIRTGLPLQPDQLVEGGMGVRVGNTNASGYDADVAPGDLQGFAGGGAGGGDGDVVQVASDEPPELLRAFQPRYPQEMKAQQIEGLVRMRVQVLPNGRAGEITLLQGVHPDLDRIAMEAVRRFRWRPARRGGRRVEGHVPISIRFVLRD